MICWFENHGNDVSSIDTYVFITSTISSRHSGFYSQKSNFRRAIGLYIARNRDIIPPTNYTLHNNVYLAPNRVLRLDEHLL
jgi:DNA-binding beta-propeller fold protein YncE